MVLFIIQVKLFLARSTTVPFYSTIVLLKFINGTTVPSDIKAALYLIQST